MVREFALPSQTSRTSGSIRCRHARSRSRSVRWTSLRNDRNTLSTNSTGTQCTEQCRMVRVLNTHNVFESDFTSCCQRGRLACMPLKSLCVLRGSHGGTCLVPTVHVMFASRNPRGAKDCKKNDLLGINERGRAHYFIGIRWAVCAHASETVAGCVDERLA